MDQISMLLTISGDQKAAGKALLLREGAQLGTAEHAVIHGLHVAGDQPGLRRCPLHRQHVLGPHDDRVESVDTRGARVQDDHLGPMRGNGLLDIAVPDGVARHVQCFVNSKDREVISLPVFPLNASFRQACLSQPLREAVHDLWAESHRLKDVDDPDAGIALH